MDRGAWRATVHEVAESDITNTRHSMLYAFSYNHLYGYKMGYMGYPR